MKVDTLLKVIPRHLDVITIQESENIKFSTLTDSIVRIGSVGAWVIDIKRGRVISLF